MMTNKNEDRQTTGKLEINTPHNTMTAWILGTDQDLQGERIK